MDEAVVPLPGRVATAHAMRRGENVIDPRPLKLSIADLVLLDREWSGIDRYHHTELIDGRTYHTPARFRPRARAVMNLFMMLRDAVKEIDHPPFVGTLGSIESQPYDLPLPDLVLTYEIEGDGFIPAPSVPLVVEVSESALAFFLGEKLRCYARMRIPEYWVVDVNKAAIHQMWSPEGETYAERREIAFGSPITAATIPGLTIATEAL